MSEQTVTPEATTEAPEATEPQISEDELNGLAKMVLESQRAMVADYNTRLARISNDDPAKYLHEIRNTSEDDKVAEYRKYEEKVLAALEKRTQEIEAYIKANLMGNAPTEDEVKAEREALGALKKEITEGEKYFGIATKALGKDTSGLLPKMTGARLSKSGGGTGQGGVKPRVTGVYINGELQSHVVKKDNVVQKNEDGTDKVSSTFTDAVRYLSEQTKTKVATTDLQAAYFAAAQVEPADWASGPDKVEFVFNAGEKNWTVLVTK